MSRICNDAVAFRNYPIFDPADIEGALHGCDFRPALLLYQGVSDMVRQHDFTSTVEWTGNRGDGTASYRAYDRTWDIAVPGRAVIHCSNDPLLGGDPALANPEDLLLSALSACHMLCYLHRASEAGIVVHGYRD